jgi:hypothetical protein
MEEREQETHETAAERAAQRARERSAARRKMEQQATWVDLQIRQAMDRGDFDDLPGHGKPIADLDGRHDPDWWLKRFVERENIHGVLPPALQVRRDDADLDDRLDGLTAERQVREAVEEFNEAVRRARFQPLGGPPMITEPRDVETEVARWKERRAERRRAAEAQASLASGRSGAERPDAAEPRRPGRRWWSRRPS